MIQSVHAFINYFGGVRRRTLNYIQAIPPDKFGWSPKPGELECGDIVRHMGSAEKMFARVALKGNWHYDGHARELAGSLEEAIRYLDGCHTEATAILGQLNDADLNESRQMLNGPAVKAWRLLLAMTEHEVHHRSQLAVYLALMGVEPPQIYGLKIEDIVELTTT
jgi:uncharacterized damage-inducible protein DinB